ncbi:MAG TPA: glycosyltransferase family 39 protein, partial [Chloroflexia bacterium]|nr:glycosyltransferase family 39 protein [Chloroflexia bacterium]
MTAIQPRVLEPYLPTVPAEPEAVPHSVGPIRGGRRGLVLGTAAWVLALWGLSLTVAGPERTAAMLVLAVAGLLAVIAWWATPVVPGLPRSAAGRPLLRRSTGRVLRLAGIAGAAVLAWQADTQFLAHPAEVFGLAGWLWLAGMGLLVAATLAWPRDAVSESDEPRPEPWTRREVAALGGLLAAALLLRLWDLQNVPFVIHRDEILAGEVARSTYLNGQVPMSVFTTLWDQIDLPALWFMALATAMKLGGEWLAILRLPSALFGAFTVLPFYGLVRGAWGRAAALAGTAVLTYSAVDIHYSRVNINNIVTPFFWATCFFFLLRGLRGRRPVDWALAGIAAGLSEYGYYGTHLLPFLLLAFAAYLLIVHWRQGWRYLGHFGLLALGYLVAFGPLLAYFIRM